MTHTLNERRRAAAWKIHTDVLPVNAKIPAPYVGKDGGALGTALPFCLPSKFADHNLLPAVREAALALFAELEVPWHAGIAGGPGNHLLSSQVQCVNALMPMVNDPSRVAVAFGAVVDVGEVLETEPGRFLTFEYIGPEDFFGEAPGRERIRGAHCTSVDAAFLHCAADGAGELVLVEWKYTESYRVRKADSPRDEVRRARYAAAVNDPTGPVRGDLLAFEHLLDEPFYQLTRQQLLAHALEQSGVADRVRVVLVLPPANDAYQQSLARPEHRDLGATVSEVWHRLLRSPDRFATLDSAVFLDPGVTSVEYRLRYAPDVVWNQTSLLELLQVDDADAVGDVLDWPWDVELHEGGVDLRQGMSGTGLAYPFRLQELMALAAELEAESEAEPDSPHFEDVVEGKGQVRIDHAGLLEALAVWGARDVDDSPDYVNSVSGVVIRCVYEGRRTVAVGSDATTEQCIGAVLDLLDVHLHEGSTYRGAPVDGDRVSVVLGERSNSEALDAIGTLLHAMRGGPSIEVLVTGAGEKPLPLPLAAADFSGSAKAQQYLELMEALAPQPPALLTTVRQGVGREELRAYPMLTANPWWSLRLEGLEVGRFRDNYGWLDVGAVGKTGKIGKARSAWVEAVADPTRVHVTEDSSSIAAAIEALTAFAGVWLGPVGAARQEPDKQNEHALESRILRGDCLVTVNGRRLELLQRDPVVNWGSQFPTRWGHTKGNAARYLDALLRDGDVPWAVEMKVRGSGGVGGYYRHAVAQAVLYRHFIRSAEALQPWFAAHGLDQGACRTAVVVPDLDRQPTWRHRLRAVCRLVDVELVEVSHHYAALR
ncbi:MULTISPECIES: PGN_0703 family putative restriction endonuclease [unclassified Modestobacter]|uniref:PGN_0703 family putative restriction endonuclease n=1 Tax=unclassified Modestobacter TaxID=2643866 RepID=UPI0022AB2442|nr:MULTISPECIES: hypothetical protein [unclassified Modestobacter]MCZ2826084.1 hypothetical protein [Modestobacter sp. VKM Ac-2981]MCZ2852851.1 hypothetical protein [Modestobacter sp. VKM Ac-2982]